MGIALINRLERLSVMIFVACIAVMSPQAFAFNSKPEHIKAPELFIFADTQSSRSYRMEEKDKAIAALFDTACNENNSRQARPIFVYIHGRALGHKKNGYDEEPEESKTDVIPELFSRYHASKILMFHWPHWGNGNDYNSPAEDARLAAVPLASLLASINDAAKNKTLCGPLILISHSMGSIVLEEAVVRSSALQFGNFHTVAIFAPASRYDNSWIWLSKINATHRYVFANAHDPTLRWVNDALGKCDAACLSKRKRAERLVYIDISPLELGHRYFVFGAIKGKEKILSENVVQPMLTGGEPKFPGAQPDSSKNIYIVRPEKRETGDRETGDRPRYSLW
jgi:hypothetical protein